MEQYDVAIIGAGPAGLFAGYTLLGKKIVVIEKGKEPKKRNCPQKKNYECGHCNPCNIMSGVGGAGLFSDGKLNFISKLGKTDLIKILGNEEEADKLIDYTEEIFNKFGMDSKVYPSDMDKARELRKKAVIEGAELLIIRQKHLGSDMLSEYIDGMMNYLKENNLEFLLSEVAEEFLVEDGKVVGVKTNKREIRSKYVIAAPGRAGSEWLGNECSKLGINVDYGGVEVGVRVEVKNEIMEDITDIIYDPTFFITSKTHRDLLRTFCTNRGGFVTKETYPDFVCVNGHAEKNRKSENTNFAFLSKVTLTEPVTDGHKYARSIGRLSTTIGGGKPILQTYGDLKQGRRSTEKKIRENFVKPTLIDVTPGNITMALTARIVNNLIEGLEKLDKIIHGVASDSTLLYAPEIKFFCNEVENDCLKTSKGIYVAGDGAGVAGNIVSSAATGILAARRILEEL